MLDRTSEARSRLLGTASRLFYAEGLHSVGIGRIVAEAQVTRATLYRHFPSKDDLVVAYLTEADKAIRGQVGAARDRGGARSTSSESIAAGIRAPGFRGCAFRCCTGVIIVSPSCSPGWSPRSRCCPWNS